MAASTCFGVRHLVARTEPGTAAAISIDGRAQRSCLIEGLDDAERADPAHRRRRRPSRRSPFWPTPIASRCARWSIRSPATAPSTRRCCGRNENDARVEFIDLPSDIFLGLQDLEAKRRNRLATKPRERAAKQAEQTPEETPSRRRTLGGPSAAESIYEQIAERSGEAGLRHLLGTPLRAQSRGRQLPAGRVRTGPGAARRGRSAASGVPRTWSAKRTCAGGSRRSSPRASSRSRSSPSSAPFTPRC